MLLAYAQANLEQRSQRDLGAGRSLSGQGAVPVFPDRAVAALSEALEHHRLRREIIATQLTNSIINRGGPSLIARMTDETGASADRIVRAFAAVRDSYGMTELNGEIDALDNKIPGALQLDLYAAVKRLMMDRMVWFIRMSISIRD